MPLPRSMSSLTLCSAWKKWETILLNPGRSKFNGTQKNDYFSELNRIDGQLVEFVWKIFTGFDTVGILNKIQQMLGELQCEPETFTGRIIFMSMFHDIVWAAKGNDELCENNSKTIWKVCWKISSRSLVFPGAWIWKEVVRNVRWQTRWILHPTGGENAA